MAKRSKVVINSFEQFERIYLPKKASDLTKIPTPYEYGVTLARQAIEKYTMTVK